MKNIQELLNVLSNVKEEDFDQDWYARSTGHCGCVLHWFEIHKCGISPTNFSPNGYFDLGFDECWYIFGGSREIVEIAKRNQWPVPTSFTVQDAIERIKFISSISLTSQKLCNTHKNC